MTDSEAGRIFVGGISWKADEESLANFFSSFGKIIECRIIMDKNTKKSKGYGFITFEDPEAAEKVKLSNNLYFLGKMMNVGDAVRKEPTSTNATPGRPQTRGEYSGGYENATNAGYLGQRGEYYQQGQYYPQQSQFYSYQGGYPSQYQAMYQQGTPQQGSNQSTNQSNQSHTAQNSLPTPLTPQQQQQVYQNLAALQQLQHLHQLQQYQRYQQQLFLQQNPQFQHLYQQHYNQQQLMQLQQQHGQSGANPNGSDGQMMIQSGQNDMQAPTQ